MITVNIHSIAGKLIFRAVGALAFLALHAHGAPLGPDQQALLRDAAAGIAGSRAIPNQRVVEGRRLASALGAENRAEAALLLIDLGEPVLYADFAGRANQLIATPELEAAALATLTNSRFERCLIASTLRQARGRALYEAVRAEALTPEPSRYPLLSSPQYCVRAMARIAPADAEADLAQVLAIATDPLEARGIAERLAERRQPSTLPAFERWLDRHALRHLGSAAGILLTLGPGSAAMLARQLARFRDQPLDDTTLRSAESLIAILRHLDQGIPWDARVLAETDLPRFAPPLREKVAALLQERQRDSERARQVNTDNLLHWVRQGATEQVRDFLARGANPNAQGDNADERPLLLALKAGRWEILKLLLDAGADPNVKDWRGNPALKLLAAYKAPNDELDAPTLAAARLLIDKGAQVSAPGESRRTPLHVAVSRNFPAMARLLIERGADLNAEAEELGLVGLTPLQLAEDIRNEAMVRLLRDKGARTNLGFSARRAMHDTARTILAPILVGH